MVMRQGEDIRRTLADRVASRVAGRGIARSAIDEAVDGVMAALGSQPQSDPTVSGGAMMVAAVSGLSAPDLASRLRGALAREGVAMTAMGMATSGRHTVITLQLPVAARQALERLATEQSLSLSIDPALQPPA